MARRNGSLCTALWKPLSVKALVYLLMGLIRCIYRIGVKMISKISEAVKYQIWSSLSKPITKPLTRALRGCSEGSRGVPQVHDMPRAPSPAPQLLISGYWKILRVLPLPTRDRSYCYFQLPQPVVPYMAYLQCVSLWLRCTWPRVPMGPVGRPKRTPVIGPQEAHTGHTTVTPLYTHLP